MRSYILFVSVLLTFFAQTQNKIQDKVNQLVKNPNNENATVVFLAIDLDSGDTLGKWNHKSSLPYASNTKLFSTYTALELLGENYRPRMRFYVEGDLNSEGVLNGNLWIRGGGDISLGSKYFSDSSKPFNFFNNWADTLIKLGIREITGSVISDGSEFGYEGAPDGWEWSDLTMTYGAPPSGICFADNVMNYYFKSGSAGTIATLIKTSPELPGINVHSNVKVAGNGNEITIYGGPLAKDRFAKGYISPNQSSYAVQSAMVDPELQFVVLLEEYFQKKGIKINSVKAVRDAHLIPPNYSTLKLVYTNYGSTLSEIITKTNMHSVNFFAEGLVNLVGFEKTGNGSTESGLNQMNQFWSKKINSKGLFINDGSGLSRSNAMSPSHYVEMLRYIYNSKNYATFLSSLPVAGISGTLGKVCAGQDGQGRVKAKSGTLTRVKAYSGYVQSKSGKNIAFSIAVNNFTCSKGEIVNLIEPVLNAMAAY
ncbi:MAG: D-alanyl-D-alanine carboxypeptidase/D-alanyl-D-alanine-endopeptidase [Bacteroidota bacterium]